MTASPTSCPRCGAAASGNFCAACGAPLGPRHCTACGTALSPGANFCHKCGTSAAGGAAPAGVPAAREPFLRGSAGSERTPWIIAGGLVIVVIAAVLYSATRRGAPSVPVMANAGNATPGVADNPSGANAPTVRAPPIDNMTPKEQFTRLDTRITQAMEKGDTTTVVNFTPMALGAYANLPAADRDIDTRYHVAILQAQVGMFANARALADTIMAASPGNLFGYYIRATVAEVAGDSAAAKAARADFRAHYAAEMKKNRPEYTEHRPMLEQFRTGDGAK